MVVRITKKNKPAQTKKALDKLAKTKKHGKAALLDDFFLYAGYFANFGSRRPS